MVTGQATQERQRGLILGMALVFLMLLTLSAAMSPRLAALDLGRASAVDAWSRADAAAATGLARAVENGGLLSTAAGTVARGRVGDADYVVEREFLGHFTEALAGDENLTEWHFLLTAAGTADRGARVVHAQHLMVLAPAPPDPGACLDRGCSVPPICSGAAPCDAGLHAVPFTVGWHMPEVEE
jgi:hypothetical protein